MAHLMAASWLPHVQSRRLPQPRERSIHFSTNHHHAFFTSPIPSAMPIKPILIRKPRLFRRLGRRAARTHTQGQGFVSSSFAKEQRVVAREWKAIRTFYPMMNRLQLILSPVERSGTDRLIILSDAAKAHIKTCTEANLYGGRVDTKGPHLMAPSVNPNAYSMVRGVSISLKSTYLIYAQWCSFCHDFSELIVACSGCRVGVCCDTRVSNSGCVGWSADILKTDFIFLCPLCSREADVPCPVCEADLGRSSEF